MPVHLPRSPLSRRNMMRAAGAALVGTVAPTPAQAAARADAYAAVRDRWAALTSGGAIDPGDPVYAAAIRGLNAQASAALAALDAKRGRTRLFRDLPLGSDSAHVTSSFRRLGTLAAAYVTPGTACAGNASVLADIVGGLDFLTGAAYSASGGLPRYGYGNWWDWQIGAPQALQDAANLVRSALTADQIAAYCAAIDHFVTDPTVLVQAGGASSSTGANRLDLCRVVIVRGALGEDASRIAIGVAGIRPALALVTSGDGLYADGSFVQHDCVPYTGTYGGVWLGDAARLLSALAGTAWLVGDPGIRTVLTAATSAFAPVVYNGLMLDSVRGRAITRAGEPDHADGLTAARNLIILSGTAPDPATATRLKSIAKGWLQRTPAPVTAGGSIPSIALAQQVLADTSLPAAPEPVGHTLFPSMDRAVHRRPGWAASISMASHRTAHYETGSGNNLRGWHTGDGMTQLYLDTHNTQYSNAFWPTADPYRLPGTTASQLPLADAQGGAYAGVRPDTSWVGGTTDGEFAAIGQDLRGPFSTLTAKKSWFCLDDSIVCLGAGITCRDTTEVDTVVDTRNLGTTGRNTLTVDAVDQPSHQGWSQTFGNARWARIDGHAGYVFPGGATVTAQREQRTGSWRDIDAHGSTTPLTRNHLSLRLCHGTDPTDATYAYVLLPGAQTRQVARYAADRGRLRVLANTPAQQGIAVPALGLTAVSFFTEGTVDTLTTSAPACVLIREHHDGTATLCLADPRRQATTLALTWNRPVHAITSAPPSLTHATAGRALRLTFGDLTGLAGATQHITVALG